MADADLIVGLDVGTTKIAACAGRVSEGGFDVVAVSSAPTSGVRKGMITDIEEAVSAIGTVLEQLEHQAVAPISSVVAGIGGVEVTTMESKGAIAVARPDGEITAADTVRAVEAARSVTLPPNREVLHVLPKSYATDHDERVHNPVGTTSIRLEVHTELILISSLALRNLERAITQTGLTLSDIVFSPLATATAALSKKQLEIGVALIDIGAATTDLAVFEEGQLIHAAVIPIGSQHFTNDIAIGVRTNLEVAEQLKREVGTALSNDVKASEVVRLADYDPNDRETIKRRELAEIIEARLDELFAKVNEELKGLDRDGRLPAGAVLTGNGARLTGLVDYTKGVLKLPATLGRTKVELPIPSVDTEGTPDYTTSAGLLLWGLEHSSTPPSATPIALPNLPTVNVGGVIDRAKDLLKQFLP